MAGRTSGPEARRQSRLKRRRRPIALALFLAAVAALFLRGTGPAVLAHAVLLRSDPAQNARLGAAPAKVDLFFSEPVDHQFSTIQVRDTAGGRQDKKDVQFTGDPTEMTVGLPQLGPGFYTVAWTTVSAADGHRLEGTFPFTVLNADGSTPAGTAPVSTSGAAPSTGVQPFDAALRWLLWAGLLGIAGGFGFAAFVLYPAAAALPRAERRKGRGFALWLLGAVVPAAALIVLITNLAVLLRQAEVDGGFDQVGSLLSVRTGTYWIVRETLAALSVLLAWWLTRQERKPDGTLVVALLGLGLFVGLGGLGTMSLTSHAAAGKGAYWAVPSDFLHLSGVALWLGSLVQLPALLRIQRSLEGRPRLLLLGHALQRFSKLAMLCVGLILLTGTFNALVQLPDWSALPNTAYGRALLVKLVFVGGLLALGLWNATLVARRLERLALAFDQAAERQAIILGRTAILESAAGALVVAATAVMIFLVPAKDARAQDLASRVSRNVAPVSSVYRNQAPAGDLSAALTVTPNRVGENDFKVLLSGPDVNAVSQVQLRFQFASQGVGESRVVADAVPGTAGLFAAKAANFGFVGYWRVMVNVRRSGHDDVNGAFTVEVPDVNGATTSTPLSGAGRDAAAFPAHGISSEQAWGALLVAVGVLVFVFRKQLWAVNRLAGTAGVFGISGAVVVGVAVVIMGAGKTSGQAAIVQNPIPADTKSVTSGKDLYATKCVQCHGTTGHGDGPSAAGLTPKPLDLTVHVGLHPDSQLFDWISNGVPRSAMPAWKGQITETQRWDLVNYLRTLSQSADLQAPQLPSGSVAAH